MSTKAKFLILIIVALFTTSILVSAVELYTMYEEVQRQTHANIRSSAKQTAQEIDTWFSAIRQAGKALAETPSLQTGSPQHVSELLSTLHHSMPVCDPVMYLDKEGRILNLYPYYEGRLGSSNADRPYFKATLQSQTSQVSDIIMNRSTGKPAVVITHPVKNPAGEMTGMILQVLDLEFLQVKVDTAQVGQNGYASMSTADGRLIAHKNQALVVEGKSVIDEFKPLIETKSTEVISVKNRQDEASLGVAVPVSSANWSVQILIPEHEIMAGFYNSVKHGSTLLIVVILVCSAIAWFVFSRLFRPISDMAVQVTKLGEGDLTVDVKFKSEDELGKLAGAINAAVRNFRHIVGSVQRDSENVSASSQQLAATSDQVGRVVQQIAQNTGEIARGAVETGQMIFNAAQQTNQLTTLAEDTTREMQALEQNAASIGAAAKDGQTHLAQTTAFMENIAATTQKNATSATELGEKSEKVRAIVEIINSIANQTNLLALNAAIEAARAGEHGRGFAVVADEVRKLAEQSMQSADQIGQIITAMLMDVQQVVSAFDSTSAAMEQGMSTLFETNKSFADILQRIEQTLDKTHEVVKVAERQSQAADALKSAVHQVATIAEESSAATETTAASAQQLNAAVQEIASSAQALSQLASELQNMVVQFKL